jgi:hypothetical protein
LVTDLSGQTLHPVLNVVDQRNVIELKDWHLKRELKGYSETSVRKYKYLLPNSKESKYPKVNIFGNK